MRSLLSDTPRNLLRFIVDNPRLFIVIGIIITILFAFKLPELQLKTSIYDLAIEDISENTDYKAFKERFGNDEIILVVVKSENIFDPDTFNKVDRIARVLAQIKGVKRVISLPQIKGDMDLTGKWTIPDFEKAIIPVTLFRRNLVSTDKKTTVITLILENTGFKDDVINAVENVITKEKHDVTLYQIGMPLVSKALADYTKEDFVRLPPATFLAIALILFLIFRNLRGVFIPAGSVLVSLIWTFGLMAWTGTPVSMLNMIVPIFIIAVGTAYCMYVFPEYRDTTELFDNPKDAVFACFEKLGFPTILAVITTSIGLLSLLLNQISAIREFAVFSCFGIWCMAAMILVFQPAILACLPGRRPNSPVEKKDYIAPVLQKIIEINLRHQKKTIPIVVIITLFAFAGIFRIKMETNPIGYFKENTEVRQNFNDIYRDMAGSFPINVVLNSQSGRYFKKPENLKLILKVQGFLDSLEGVDKTISFADYFQLVNYAGNKFNKAFYALPEEDFEVRMAMNDYKTMLGKDMFDRFMDADMSRVNIILRTHISSSKDFLKLKDDISAYLIENLPKNFSFKVTGFGIVISQSSHLLSEGQLKSLSVTFFLIFGMMFFLFLSYKVGIIALIPNLFPIIINFGIMGWLGIELSMITSLIASIAIGLAVDDTIHYMVRYNREFKKDLEKERALKDTILKIGRPIIFTTFTIAIGFSFLLFSKFQPTAIFGMMMVVTMFSALVGDLIILPSLMTHVELVTVWDLLKLKLGKDPQKGIPLFKRLARSQVHYILMAGSIKKLEQDRVLFSKGETSDSMYAIIDGELRVLNIEYKKIKTGSETIINTLKTGDIVGEMGMVRSCQRSATVIANKPTELLEINKKMIRRLQWLYPPTAQKFFFNLMSIICDRLEYTTECLSDLTTSDPSTGLPNLKSFMASLKTEMARANRYGADLSICMIGLDNIGDFDFIKGHGKWNPIFAEIGELLQEGIRSSDRICRCGKAKFALMLVNTPREEAGKTCERFIEKLSGHVFGTAEAPFSLASSAGVTSINQRKDLLPKNLMKEASRAQVKAVESGNNGTELFKG